MWNQEKKWVSFLLIVMITVIIGGQSVGAGEVAQFVNLGFSSDGRYFAFGQYGIADRSNIPFAELYVVDVVQNRLVPNIMTNFKGTAEISFGQDGQGALFRLYRENVQIIEKHSIDHLALGRPIYLHLDGGTSSSLTFRDFDAGNQYTLELNERVRSDSAAFDIDIAVEFANGTTTHYDVGLPNFYRTKVQHYQISQVLLAPTENMLVIVIAKEMAGEEGISIEYMVETVAL